MTDTSDRLAEIRARLDAAKGISPGTNLAEKFGLAVSAGYAIRDNAADDLAFLLELVDQLQVQLDDRNNLIRDLHDPGPCLLDHHGYCQEHNWFETDPPCPDSRAQALVQALGVPGDR